MRKYPLLITVLVATFAVFLFNGNGAFADDLDEDTYLALGDSLAVGDGASDPATTAYVPLFHQFLLDDDDMALLNLGDIGDTSTTLITHSHLTAAVTELETGDVEVVTVNIGGNDVFALLPVCLFGFTPPCTAAVTSTFATFSANLDFILAELRAAAGDDTPIIVMTYYNPLPGCFLAPFAPLADIVLEGGGPLPAGLNDLIRSIAASHDAKVAETFGKLGAGDLVGGFDCLHANDDGYEIIAEAFIDAFEDDEDDEDDDDDDDD